MTADTNEEKLYKANLDVREQIRKELEANMSKFNDPVVLGTLMSRMLEERENTNRLLKTLLQRIEQLEERLAGAPQRHATAQQIMEAPMLPEVDEAIVSFIREGPKTAEDVQHKFGYKGKNAASARLNRLHDLGVVVKKHVGKKVYFSLS